MIHISGTVHIDFEADVRGDFDIDDDVDTRSISDGDNRATEIVEALLTEKFGVHRTDIKHLETVDDDLSIANDTARLKE